MKPLALWFAVLALLCPGIAAADDHKDDCKRVRKAADKLDYIVKNSWGENRANVRILAGAEIQAQYDIEKGKTWAAQLATLTVDPQTGDPLDCTAIRDKHADFLKAYEELRPKFKDAANTCADQANAVNGKCGKAADEIFKARSEFIRTKMAPFLTTERAGALYCQAAFNGYLSGVSTLADGRLPEPCARPNRPGGRAVCSDIPLKNMRDAAKDACKNELEKIKDPVLQGAKAMCPSINKVRDGFEALRADFNKPNKVFFEASIGAAVAHKALLNIKRVACDGVVGTPAGGSGGGESGGGSGGSPNNGGTEQL